MCTECRGTARKVRLERGKERGYVQQGLPRGLALENPAGGGCPAAKRDEDVHQTKGTGMVSVSHVYALSMLNTLIKARNKTHKSC